MYYIYTAHLKWNRYDQMKMKTPNRRELNKSKSAHGNEPGTELEVKSMK